MNKKSRFLILFTVLAMLSFIIASVSAQEIDVDSMDNEQLTALLMQILDKLQQQEGPEKEVQVTPELAVTEVSSAEPERIEEVLQITVYDNKKLIVESLPAYMFIQPTQPPSPQENKKPDSPSKTGGSTSTREDLETYCTGICMGYSEFYGTMMLDMGCYAKCVGDI